MRKINFTNNEYYHIYNRGVDKRKIFLDKNDYIRFIHDLYEFNNEERSPEFARLYTYKIRNRSLDTTTLSSAHKKPRKKLVEILCFCQMPNHFHLLLKQLVENGIPKFMQKLGTGYTMAFNLKQERSGALFQGAFKATHIKNETYLTHLSRYIHLNPVALKNSKWKETEIKRWSEVNDFLENYQWSSYPSYIGKENFSSVFSKDLILNIIGNKDKYKKFIQKWALKELTKIKGLTLE